MFLFLFFSKQKQNQKNPLALLHYIVFFLVVHIAVDTAQKIDQGIRPWAAYTPVEGMMVKGEERFVSCAKLECPLCVFVCFDSKVLYILVLYIITRITVTVCRSHVLYVYEWMNEWILAFFPYFIYLYTLYYDFWFFLSSKRSTSFYSVGTFFGSFWRRQKDLPPSYLMDTVFGSFWRRQKDLPLSLLLVRFLVLFVVSKKINLHSIVLCSINI